MKINIGSIKTMQTRGDVSKAFASCDHEPSDPAKKELVVWVQPTDGGGGISLVLDYDDAEILKVKLDEYLSTKPVRPTATAWGKI